MKHKIIGLGGVLFFIGVSLIFGLQHASAPPPGHAPAPIHTAPASDGHVVANDDAAGSGPYHTDLANTSILPQPLSVLRASIEQKSQRPREKTVVINNKEYPLRTYRPLMAPNDPMASQWWVTNTKLNQAWDTPNGSRQTLLAIIDTGFALKHEEFINRWYTNPGESGAATSESPSTLNCSDRGLPLSASCNLIDDDADGIIDNESGPATYQNPSRLNCTDQGKPLTKDCNRVDDDNNGHIDDVTGWDFVNNDNSVQAGELNPSGSGTTHGTMVAGVAAATGNNGKGLSGVDWNTKILPIQALDDDSYGDTLSVGRAIFYAADRGADVISLSLGSSLSDAYVREAVQYAIARGSIVVAASGNDGCDCMVYPAHYPEVVGVGALNSSNQRASFSSYGSSLDILAPGTSINSSTWTSGNGTSAYVSGINGTSFATPIVSGMFTRLLSQQPSATPLQLIAAMTENTNRLTIPSTTSQDNLLGFGALDALKATARVTSPNTAEQAYSFTPISTGQYSAFTPSEVTGTDAIEICQNGIIGTTPIYELVSGSTRFYTISDAEAAKAQAAGYSSTLLSRTCLQQPQDIFTSIRSINVLHEFRNIYDKP